MRTRRVPVPLLGTGLALALLTGCTAAPEDPRPSLTTPRTTAPAADCGTTSSADADGLLDLADLQSSGFPQVGLSRGTVSLDDCRVAFTRPFPDSCDPDQFPWTTPQAQQTEAYSFGIRSIGRATANTANVDGDLGEEFMRQILLTVTPEAAVELTAKFRDCGYHLDVTGSAGEQFSTTTSTGATTHVLLVRDDRVGDLAFSAELTTPEQRQSLVDKADERLL